MGGVIERVAKAAADLDTSPHLSRRRLLRRATRVLIGGAAAAVATSKLPETALGATCSGCPSQYTVIGGGYYRTCRGSDGCVARQYPQTCSAWMDTYDCGTSYWVSYATTNGQCITNCLGASSYIWYNTWDYNPDVNSYVWFSRAYSSMMLSNCNTC